MQKLFLTTALAALFTLAACDSKPAAKKEEAKATSSESKAADSKATETSAKDGSGLETPKELQAETVKNQGMVEDVERIVMNMVKRDPQKFMETIQMAAQFQQAKQELEIRNLLDTNKDKLTKEDDAIVLGNSKGNVTFVLVADPLCSNCRTLEAILHNVIKKNPSLKVIMHQWAFVDGGEQSSRVARYLSAAYKADAQKFGNLHKAFLMLQEMPNDEKLNGLIKGAGYDLDKIKADAESDAAKAKIESVRTLAKELKLPGAPVLMAMTPDGQLGIIPMGGNEDDISKIVSQLAKEESPSKSGKKAKEAA